MILVLIFVVVEFWSCVFESLAERELSSIFRSSWSSRRILLWGMFSWLSFFKLYLENLETNCWLALGRCTCSFDRGILISTKRPNPFLQRCWLFPCTPPPPPSLIPIIPASLYPSTSPPSPFTPIFIGPDLISLGTFPPLPHRRKIPNKMSLHTKRQLRLERLLLHRKMVRNQQLGQTQRLGTTKRLISTTERKQLNYQIDLEKRWTTRL
jgi:hypothetical protein